MSESSTIAAGIDTAKHKLDVAVDGRKRAWQVPNTAAGITDLVELMRRHQVTRIGIEATGGYEREVVERLRGEGFAVACGNRSRSAPLHSSPCAAPRPIVSTRS